jgi:hypothetical protein
MSDTYSRRQKINNFVAFQIMWFSAALLAEWQALIVGVALVVWLYQVEPWSKDRLQITAVFFCFGLAMDLGLTWGGVHRFAVSEWQVPVWYPLLWLMFSTSMTLSLIWLFDNTWWCIVAGLILAPLSYMAAAKVGVLYEYSWLQLGVIGSLWSIYLVGARLFLKRHKLNCPFTQLNKQ